ncbi:MAG: hypothetical protein EBS29_08080, partial [Chloroflexia bacterium]|nr:hypothetical protein [Chloroflexia bacterium]
MKQNTTITTTGQQIRNYETQVINVTTRNYEYLSAHIQIIAAKQAVMIGSYVLMSVCCVLLLYWQVNQPTQNLLWARQLDTIDKQIRAVELNPQGQELLCKKETCRQCPRKSLWPELEFLTLHVHNQAVVL